MSSHRYGMAALAADYVRAAVGTVTTGGILVAAQPLPIIAYLLSGLAALFAVYGLRTGVRHLSRWETDERGIRVRRPFAGALDREVRWDSLSDLRLRYFFTRRDREQGWMQVSLHGPGGVVRCDSGIEDFERIVRLAYAAASEAGLPLNTVTVTNLKSMGLALDREAGP